MLMNISTNKVQSDPWHVHPAPHLSMHAHRGLESICLWGWWGCTCEDGNEDELQYLVF